MIRTLAIALVLAIPLPAVAQSGEENAQMSCEDFVALDMEGQKEAMADIYAALTGAGDGSVVPQESVVSGEQAVTRLVALCEQSPDAEAAEVAEDVYTAAE